LGVNQTAPPAVNEPPVQTAPAPKLNEVKPVNVMQQERPVYPQQPRVIQPSGFGWYSKAMKQYADFSGRARRKEYWMFFLFNVIFSFVAILAIITWLYYLAVLIPGLAVTVRRLHDVGKSGWWMLILLIPFVGAICLLVFLCTDSETGTNRWGKNPKYELN
jgi:uncharacterized membrane protein YhaH (DUF805 family)